jgi:hypothetical protein
LINTKARLEVLPQTAFVPKQTVEHPFGTIKMWMGVDHFLMRCFKNLCTEMSLHVLALYLKRMVAIWGADNEFFPA